MSESPPPSSSPPSLAALLSTAPLLVPPYKKDPVRDIKLCAPPAFAPGHYLVVVRECLTGNKTASPPVPPPSPQIIPEILSELYDVLQENLEFTRDRAWELIPTLLHIPGADACCITIARLGSPREVILCVHHALEFVDEDNAEEFRLLLKLLSIILPRIKNRYISRDFSTSVLRIMAAYEPAPTYTEAVIDFIHALSGKKRPPLPSRKSSIALANPKKYTVEASLPTAPDPHSEDIDPSLAAINKKLLQGLLLNVLEKFIDNGSLEWAIRLQESLDPKRVVPGRSVNEEFRGDDVLQWQDTVIGQLVALARDLDLADYDSLFATILAPPPIISTEDPEKNPPTSPDAIALSQIGCLYLVTCLIFSSVAFKTKAAEPKISIYPDHANLVERYHDTNQAPVVDALLTIGLYLENSDKFVSGNITDEDFLQHLEVLSLWSANNASKNLRYCAHVLTTAILHDHPVDSLRLEFISRTLKTPPKDTLFPEVLKASAVNWLKEEIITAHQRQAQDLFATETALLATKKYIFPDMSTLDEMSGEDLIDEILEKYPFHMAALNLLFLLTGEHYAHVLPPDLMEDVAKDYLTPLRLAQERSSAILNPEDDSGDGAPSTEEGVIRHGPAVALEMLGQQITVCWVKLHE